MLSPLAINRWDFDTAAHLLVRAGVEKFFVRIFQCSSKFELTTRFREFLSNRSLPLEDSTIRELVILMMTTPNYQVT